MTAGPLSPEPRAQGWAHRRHSVNIWWKKMNKLMPPMCILPVITKIVIVHFDLSKNGHFGKAVSPKPCFSGLYPASLTGPPPAHVGAIRPMQGEGAKAAPSPTAGQLCGGTVELPCPALPRAGAQEVPVGLLLERHPPAPLAFVLRSFQIPKLLGRPKGSALGWGPVEVSLCLRTVLSQCLGSCV